MDYQPFCLPEQWFNHRGANSTQSGAINIEDFSF
jgi:hypothetical protein